MSVDIDQAQKKIGKILEDLPDRADARQARSTKGVVTRLYDVITDAKTRGYKWDELANIFRQQGLDVKGSTIAYYYRAERKRRKEEAEKAEKAEAARKKKERASIMG